MSRIIPPVIRTKLAVAKPPDYVQFMADLRSLRGVYVQRLTDALASDSCVQVMTTDKYTIKQLRMTAKQLKIALEFGLDGAYTWVKPVRP